MEVRYVGSCSPVLKVVFETGGMAYTYNLRIFHPLFYRILKGFLGVIDAQSVKNRISHGFTTPLLFIKQKFSDYGCKSSR